MSDHDKIIEQLGTFLDIPPSERKPFYSIDEVHNLIAAATLVGERRGFKAGYEKGNEEGHESGYWSGFNEGESVGWTTGYDDGYEAAGGEQQ